MTAPTDSERVDEYWVWASLFMFLRDPASAPYLRRLDPDLQIPPRAGEIAERFLQRHHAGPDDVDDPAAIDEANQQAARALQCSLADLARLGVDLVRLQHLGARVDRNLDATEEYADVFWDQARRALERLPDLTSSTRPAGELFRSAWESRQADLALIPPESERRAGLDEWIWDWSSMAEAEIDFRHWQGFTAAYRQLDHAARIALLAWLTASPSRFGSDIEEILLVECLAFMEPDDASTGRQPE